MPTCVAEQVLTFNGSNFICVNRTDSIPTCAADQFLTYNGSTFQCATTQRIAIPDCRSEQVLTASSGRLSCIDMPSSTNSSWCGKGAITIDYYGNKQGTNTKKCNGADSVIDACWGPAVRCLSGYESLTISSGITGVWNDCGYDSAWVQKNSSATDYTCIKK